MRASEAEGAGWEGWLVGLFGEALFSGVKLVGEIDESALLTGDEFGLPGDDLVSFAELVGECGAGHGTASMRSHHPSQPLDGTWQPSQS